MDENFTWFLEHYDELYQKYGMCYIVIKNCEVIGTYSELGDAIRITDLVEKPGTYNVQYCNGDESGYTAYINSAWADDITVLK